MSEVQCIKLSLCHGVRSDRCVSDIVYQNIVHAVVVGLIVVSLTVHDNTSDSCASAEGRQCLCAVTSSWTVRSV